MPMEWAIVWTGLVLAQPAVAQPVTPAAITAAVEQLGDGRFATREQATLVLWTAGEAAREPLNRALLSKDREVALRARDLLDRLDTGIRPDTPRDDAWLMLRYRQSDESQRGSILDQLCRRGSLPGVFALLRRETSAAVRRPFIARIVGDREQLTEWVLKEQAAQLDQAMQFAALWRDYHADYIAYRRFAGSKELPLAEHDKVNASLRLLLEASMLRSEGKAQEALQRVRQIPQGVSSEVVSGRRILEATLLQDLADWDALAKLAAQMFSGIDCESETERAGQLMFYHRLAGNETEVARAAEQVKRIALANPDDVWFCFEALWINDRFADADELARQVRIELAFDVLTSRGQYAAALEVADWRVDMPSASAWRDRLMKRSRQGVPVAVERLAISVGALLARLGRMEEAQSLFNHVSQNKEMRTVMTALVNAERTAGLPVWKEHAIMALENATEEDAEKDKVSPGSLVGDFSRLWWSVVREQSPEDRLIESIERIEDLLHPRHNGMPLTDAQRLLVEKCLKQVESLEPPALQYNLSELAKFCVNRKERELAQRCCRRLATINGAKGAWLMVADLARVDARWQDAADAYYKEFEVSRTALPLYLHGEMLARLGNAEVAGDIRRKARIIPFGDISQRTQLAQGLQERGLGAAALPEWQFIARTSTSWDWGHDNALQNLGNAVAKTAPREAVIYWERFRSVGLREEISFARPVSYFEISRLLCRARARDQLLRGNVPAAVAEARQALFVRPNDVQAAIYLVQEFEAAQQPEAAEEIFQIMVGHYQSLCSDFPQAGFAHNGLAWLLVKTHRQLDLALTHAQRAVALRPDDVAYIDTLARVHFVRGEYDEAILYARRCVELLPGNVEFQQQLEEFTKAAQ